MKLASIQKGQSRDGALCVVSRDLSAAMEVNHIAPTLQFALENWELLAPMLQDCYARLNDNLVKEGFLLKNSTLLAPLPRAYQWADGSAYLNHVELVRKARGAEMPENFWTDPLMYQGGSDGFLGPYEPITAIDEQQGIDFEAEVAIICDDVPMAVTFDEAREHIKLLMLVNDVSLRQLIPNEMAKGFGFFQSKPASAFSPVAVTPDELGQCWDGERVHLPLRSYLNGNLFGKPNAGVEMNFSFPQLLAHAARTRTLSAGTIIGSGTVSNKDRALGFSCIAEKRMLEIIDEGQAKTPFLRFGDTVKIEMLDEQGRSIFGAIEQKVKPYERMVK